MHRLRRASTVAVATIAIGAAGVLAGCGDSEEKNDYVDEINELQLTYVDDVTALVSENPPATPDAQAEVAEEMASLTDGLADDIEGVEPPEEVTELHDELVTTLHDVATQITDAQETIASGNPQEAAAAATELQAATSEAQTALQSIIDQINTELQG